MAVVRDAAPSPEAVLERIDSIVEELLELRRVIATERKLTSGNVSAELFGSLGCGTWDEYDAQADWRRFES